MKTGLLSKLRKTVNSDITVKTFFLAAAALTLFKLLLTAFQMISIYPGAAPIDDELMLSAAQSINAGNWLGEYSWCAMAKHMLFSVWLALLERLSVPYLIGGQLLYLAACALAAWAVRPLAKKRLFLLVVFSFLWLSPYSFAQFTTRVYIDNIYYSLCLASFAGIGGMCLRLKEKLLSALPFALLGGLSLGLAWLTKDDAVWLLPFAVCASLFFSVFTFFSKQRVSQKLFKALALPLCAALLFVLPIHLYSSMNEKYYGRYAVSDYTSSEFKDFIGAMVRADTDGPHPGVLICKSTREKLYDAVPTLAKLGAELEQSTYYNGYGWPEKAEFNSAGVIWSLRKAAYNLGCADTAQKAEAFYSDLATEINAAIDSGKLAGNKGGGASVSATLVPFDYRYLLPTVRELGNSLRVLTSFEQTSSLAPLSIATAEEAAEWSGFTRTGASYDAMVNSDEPFYTPLQLAADFLLQSVVMLFRAAIFPALFFAFWRFGRGFGELRDELKKKIPSVDSIAFILALGILLSALLRIAMISYIEVSSFRIGTSLMYLAPAGPLLLLFAAGGACFALEKLFEGKA